MTCETTSALPASSDASGRWWWVAAAAVMLLQAMLVLHHQPWVDEWQALLIAVRSPTLADLAGHLHYEGHPALWYLVLRAAHLLTPTVWTLAAVQLPIALGIQALLLFRAPFRPTDRLLLASSVFVLIEWGTIARDLSLGVLLTLGVIAARRTRWAWVATILLPQLGAQFGFVSIALLALHRADRRWSWWGAGLWLASALAAAIMVRPAADFVPAMTAPPFPAGLLTVLRPLAFLLVPIQMDGWRPTWNGDLPLGLWGPAGILFVYLSLKTVSSGLHRAVYAGLLGVTVAFSCLVYPLAARHMTLLVLMLVVLAWRDAERGRVVSRGVRVWLATSAAIGLATAALHLAMPFDGAAQAARAIRMRGLERAPWIAFPESHGTGVAAILDRDFETLPGRCGQGFIRWNTPATPGLDRMMAAMARRERYYVLADRPLRLPGFRLLAAVPPGIDGARYYLFAAGDGALPLRPIAPPCLSTPPAHDAHSR